ncbi:MAG: replication initiator protein A [Candidatus Odinarchaeia archaeon]
MTIDSRSFSSPKLEDFKQSGEWYVLKQKFKYYAVPRFLFENNRYKNMSMNAKMLYSILLGLISLSVKNELVDSNTHSIYVKMTQKKASSLLGIPLRNVGEVFRELRWYGLIKKDKIKRKRLYINLSPLRRKTYRSETMPDNIIYLDGVSNI